MVSCQRGYGSLSRTNRRKSDTLDLRNTDKRHGELEDPEKQ